jgi:hypothetical protein
VKRDSLWVCALRRGLVASVAALLLALSCANTREDPTGGETHFLMRCDPQDPSGCGSDLSCVCGVCTLDCSERSECTSFPVAECVQANLSACGATPAAHCDVPCAGDVDCRVLSPAHHCLDGACRAAEPSRSTGAGGAAGASSPDTCQPQQVPANQVLVLGDSFFASSHQITAYLEDLARSSGALPAGERYRDNSRLTNNGLALGGSGILDQYRSGADDAPVEVVIMNGGGADVLLGSCDTADASCPIIAAAATALGELFTQMADDGVGHVVYAFYPNPLDSAVHARMDALRPLAEAACAASPVACEWLDLRDAFNGQYGDYIQADGLNPTAAGSQAAAAAIWRRMQERCIAQ